MVSEEQEDDDDEEEEDDDNVGDKEFLKKYSLLIVLSEYVISIENNVRNENRDAGRNISDEEDEEDDDGDIPSYVLIVGEDEDGDDAVGFSCGCCCSLLLFTADACLARNNTSKSRMAGRDE